MYKSYSPPQQQQQQQPGSLVDLRAYGRRKNEFFSKSTARSLSLSLFLFELFGRSHDAWWQKKICRGRREFEVMLFGLRTFFGTTFFLASHLANWGACINCGKKGEKEMLYQNIFCFLDQIRQRMAVECTDRWLEKEKERKTDNYIIRMSTSPFTVRLYSTLPFQRKKSWLSVPPTFIKENNAKLRKTLLQKCLLKWKKTEKNFPNRSVSQTCTVHPNR